MDIEAAKKGFDNFPSPFEVSRMFKYFVSDKELSYHSKKEIVSILKKTTMQ